MGYTRIYLVSGRPLAFEASLNVTQRQGTIRDNQRPIAEIGQRSTNLPMYEPYQQKDERGETRDKRRKTPKENPPKEVTIH